MSARNGGVSISRYAGPRSRSRLKGETSSSKRAAQSKRLRNAPSMKEFLHKQTIVTQYRGFLRAVAMIPDDKWRIHARDEVRNSFAPCKQETNNLAISMAVKEVRSEVIIYGECLSETVTNCSMFAFSWLKCVYKSKGRSEIR